MACVCLCLASALCLLVPMLLGVSLVPLCNTIFESKCAVYALLAATGSEAAAALGFTHRAEGLVAASTPLGSDDFIGAYARSQATSVAGVGAGRGVTLRVFWRFWCLVRVHQPRKPFLFDEGAAKAVA
jgi:hypothetical protein